MLNLQSMSAIKIIRKDWRANGGVKAPRLQVPQMAPEHLQRSFLSTEPGIDLCAPLGSGQKTKTPNKVRR